jgi:hypothetical protein
MKKRSRPWRSFDVTELVQLEKSWRGPTPFSNEGQDLTIESLHQKLHELKELIASLPTLPHASCLACRETGPVVEIMQHYQPIPMGETEIVFIHRPILRLFPRS